MDPERMSFELEGTGVIITGAAKGIGLAVARRFAELGAKVSGWDVHAAPMQSESAFIHSTTADVTDETSVVSAYAASKDALGSVSVLIANAGINGPTKPSWEYSLNEWNLSLIHISEPTRPY